MHYRFIMQVVLTILGIGTALSQNAVAQTRVGLHGLRKNWQSGNNVRRMGLSSRSRCFAELSRRLDTDCE